jgi:hypothetical protein
MHLHFRVILLTAFCPLVTACANTAVPDDDMARLLVAPDKFVLYNCPDIAREAKQITARQRELEKLMAKAGADPGGRMVSTFAYRPEYLVVRGEMLDLRQTAIEKNCNFVPGTGSTGSVSDENAVIPEQAEQPDKDSATLLQSPDSRQRAPGQ